MENVSVWADLGPYLFGYVLGVIIGAVFSWQWSKRCAHNLD